MQNIDNMTNFLRLLKDKPLGFSAPYLLPDGKNYYTATRSLIALSKRVDVNISVSPLLIVDPANVSTIEAIKVTRK